MMGLRQWKFKGFVVKGAKGARAGGGWGCFSGENGWLESWLLKAATTALGRYGCGRPKTPSALRRLGHLPRWERGRGALTRRLVSGTGSCCFGEAGDGGGDDLDGFVDVGFGREAGEAQADGAVGGFFIDAHGEEDFGWFAGTR
jgi:hypothetical protein